MATPLELGGLNANLLPREVTGPIFDAAQEHSVAMQLGSSIPIGFGDTAIPTVTGLPEAGVVGLQGESPAPDGSKYYGEGKMKPVSGYTYDVSTIRPIKLSTIVVVSEEFQRTNPSGFYDRISGDLALAVGRAVDMAVLYGKSANNGATIPGVKYAAQTTNYVTLGTTPVADGGMYIDLLNAVQQVGDAGAYGYDPTAFAADPRFRFEALRAVDPFGRPILQTGAQPSVTNQVDSLVGLPVHYARSVSGRVGANTPTDIRAFVGDWQGQFKWGTALDMTLRASNEASVDLGSGPVNLWQNNLQALLVEVVFGWTFGDLEAFSKVFVEGHSGS